MISSFSTIRLKNANSSLSPWTGTAYASVSVPLSQLGVNPNDCVVVDLTGEIRAPIELPGTFIGQETPATPRAQGTTVVLCNDLDLAHRHYRFLFEGHYNIDSDAKVYERRVFLIAQTLRISGNATVSLDSPGSGPTRARRRGGDLTIVASHIIASLDGHLNVTSRGADGDSEELVSNYFTVPLDSGNYVLEAEDGGHGGSIVIAYDWFTHGPQVPVVSFSAIGGKGGTISNHLPQKPRLERVSEYGGPFRKDLPRQQGESGTDGKFIELLTTTNELPTTTHDPRFGNNSGKILAAEIFALWQLRVCESLYIQSLNAIQSQNRMALVAAMRSFGTLRQVATPTFFVAPLANIKGLLISVRDKYVLPLWHRRLAITGIAGATSEVDLFLEGASLANWIAPSGVLAVPRKSASGDKLGLIVHSLTATNEVQIIFDTRITIDPWLEQSVIDELRKTNETLAGVFDNWDLTPQGPFDIGVKDIKLRTARELIQWTVTLDATTGGLALTKLASPSGLPVELSWRFRDDPTIEGQSFEIRLSLAKLTIPPIEIENSNAKNTGKFPITIEFFQESDGTFKALQTAISIAPGQTSAIATSSSNAIVPPQAVTVHYDGNLNDLFEQVTNTALVERVRITNLLPAFLASRQQVVRWVDIELTQLSGNDGNQQVKQISGYRLAPQGIPGFEVEIDFVKTSTQNSSYRLSGLVQYEGGGKDELQPKLFQSRFLEVTESLLP
jgi:hypothetical protein